MSVREEEGRAEPPVSSCVSMKSDWSINHPPNFSNEPGPSDTQGGKRSRAMQLLCLKSKRVARTSPDPNIFHDERVLQNLLATEDRFILQCSYFQGVQKDIKPHMRRVLAGWMYEVCEEEKSAEDVFPLAINYLDRFLAVMPTRKCHLQLLGTVCMFLAFKLKGSQEVSVEKLCKYTDNSITPRELLKWESEVLEKLKWNLASVIPNDFIEPLVRRLPIPKDQLAVVREHTQTFVALCAIDERLIMNPPSMIAAGSMGAAVCGVGLEDTDQTLSKDDLTDLLAKITNTEVDSLKVCQEDIQRLQLKCLQHLNKTGDKAAQHQDHSITPADVRDINL